MVLAVFPVFASRDGGMGIHMNKQPRQVGRPIFLLDVIVEPEEILGAVPARLDSDLQEMNAHRFRVTTRQEALARARHAGQHGKLRVVVDFQGSMERLNGARAVIKSMILKICSDAMQSLAFRSWRAAESGWSFEAGGEFRQILKQFDLVRRNGSGRACLSFEKLLSGEQAGDVFFQRAVLGLQQCERGLGAFEIVLLLLQDRNIFARVSRCCSSNETR